MRESSGEGFTVEQARSVVSGADRSSVIEERPRVHSLEDLGVRAADRRQITVVQQTRKLACARSVNALQQPVVPIRGQPESLVQVDLCWEVTNQHP